MIKSYLLISLRNMWRNKGSSLLNVICLALGIASCLFVYHYVNFEESYEDFHEKASLIHRLETDTYYRGEIRETSAFTQYSIGTELEKKFDLFRGSTRLTPFSENGSTFLVTLEDTTTITTFIEKAYYGQPSISDLFTFNWVDKSKEKPLSQANTIMVSETIAQKLFPDLASSGKSVTGRQVEIRHSALYSETWTISAVFEDFPQNTHLALDVLFSSIGRDYLLGANDLGNSYTYLLVDEKYRKGIYRSQLVDLPNLQIRFDKNQDFLSTRPIEEIHLTTKITNDPGQSINQGFLLFLRIIGLVILLLALTNYVNTSIINSIERAKEIGVRKLIGISPKQLIFNLLTETFLNNIVAGVLSVFVFFLGIRLLVLYAEIPFPLSLDQNTIQESSILMLAIVLVSTLLAAYYPAKMLISLKPVEALKGKTQVASSKQSNKGSRVMRFLLVFQLAMSLAFVSGLMIVREQLSYMKQNDNKSFRMNITAKFPGVTGANEVFAETAENFRIDMLNRGQVQRASISNLYKGQIQMTQKIKPLYQINGDTIPLVDFFHLYVVDASYFNGKEYKFLSGGNFNRRFGFDFNGAIVNQAAMEAMRFESPEDAVEKMVRPYNGPIEIKGVIKNDSINDIPKMYLTGLRYPTYLDMTFNVEGSSAEKIDAALKRKIFDWSAQFRGMYFLQDKYAEQHASEENILKLFYLFTTFALLISSIGIFGLSTFTAIKRTKEIGVRKILGANVLHVLYILVYDFMKLMMVGAVIVVPLIMLGAKKWLEDYAYRINLHVGYAILPLLLIAVLAITIIVRQCWKTGILSPIKALSAE